MLAHQLDALESRASSHEPTFMPFVDVWVGLMVAWGGAIRHCSLNSNAYQARAFRFVETTF